MPWANLAAPIIYTQSLFAKSRFQEVNLKYKSRRVRSFGLLMVLLVFGWTMKAQDTLLPNSFVL